MKSFVDYGIALETFVRNTPRPAATRTYYAYKFGEVREFKNSDEAMKFSPLVDFVIELHGLAKWNAEVIRLEHLQKETWLADLRAELSNLSDQEFQEQYETAASLENSHDEIADVMIMAYKAREEIDATVAYELMQHQMLQLEIEHAALVQKIVDLREKMIMAKR